MQLDKPKSTLKERLRRSIRFAQEKIDRCEAFLTDMERCPFKVGDFVHHKELGNCMFKNLQLQTQGKYIDDSAKLTAIIVGLTGRVEVELKDLMPCNNSTETLYGRSK